ncbi:MAG: phosphoribosyltransferase [Succinivibrionaceae bacterium]
MIVPRFKYPDKKNILKNHINKDGFFLSRYNIGLGEFVAKGKYKNNPACFDTILVNEMAEMIKYCQQNQYVVSENLVIAYVPSLRHETLVKNFAERLSKVLNIECVAILKKDHESRQQKLMQNSALQFANIKDSFIIDKTLSSKVYGKNVYLIDDMVDSKWTFTVCGILLLDEAKAQSVTPFALADTSIQED